MVILYPSPSNLFKSRGMKFFSHPSIPSLSFPCITKKKKKVDHRPCLPLQSSWTVNPFKRTWP